MIQPQITKLIQSTESWIVSFLKIGLLCKHGAPLDWKYLNWKMILFPLILVAVAPAGPTASGLPSFQDRCNHKYAKRSDDRISYSMFSVNCCSSFSTKFTVNAEHTKPSLFWDPCTSCNRKSLRGSWCWNICLYWRAATWSLAAHTGSCAVQPQHSEGPCGRKRRHTRMHTFIIFIWIKKSDANMDNQETGGYRLVRIQVDVLEYSRDNIPGWFMSHKNLTYFKNNHSYQCLSRLRFFF